MKFFLIAFCSLLNFHVFGGEHRSKNNSAYPDRNTLNGKVMFGYQGWQGTPKDGAGNNGWKHWFENNRPDSAHAVFDFWPDMSEYSAHSTEATDMIYGNGQPARLYSAFNYETVDLHFKWMEDYKLDGVFQQRFITEIKKPSGKKHFDQVVRNVKRASEKYHRVFCIMYDISGGGANWKKILVEDWKFLVDSLHLTEGKSYLHHKNKPLLAIWGLGFEHNSFASAQQVDSLIAWFHYKAPEKYRTTIFAGVNDNWREQDTAWKKVYEKIDVISPWAVGRYRSYEGADNFCKTKILPDMALCKKQKIDYMPVVFPGFSWYNLRHGRAPFNQISRESGQFFWRQVANVMKAGVDMLYIAMFDEVDEGTAMYKLSASVKDKPQNGKFLSLDQDGVKLPSDWYLKLAALTSEMLKGKRTLQEDFWQATKNLR